MTPAGAVQPPRLSVCIPTYNFGAFIGETLASIARQRLDDVEVVILDGGSTDRTSEVVAGFATSIPRLIYVHRDVRGGIDRDIEFAVERASGDYVWLFSADDIMVDGAIMGLLERIRVGDDVLLCETVICDLHLGNQRPYWNSRVRTERAFDLDAPSDRADYLRLAVNTQALFSFCGSVIFSRQRWLRSPYDGAFIGTCWSHVARLLSLIPGGLRLRHIPLAWSWKRGDNDSFAERGIVNRVRIGIEGYLALGERFFGPGSSEQGEIERLLAAEYTLRHVLAQKILLHRTGKDGDIPDLVHLFARVRRFPTPANLLAIWSLRLAPVMLLGLARDGVRALRRKRSSAGERGAPV